jgi:putative ABC transport system substrate-binding protein
MRRREFLGVLGGTAVVWPLAARAQQVRRIGALMGIANDALGKTYADAFQQGLQELGWTAGRNIRIDYVWASGAADMRQYARELMRSGPDVVLAMARQPQ